MNFITKLLNILGENEIEGLKKIISEINDQEEEMRSLTIEEMRLRTIDFQKRLKEGKTLDDILSESYALVREAARRTLGQRHFDVQLMGGIILHRGKIAEMKTGEGKTLVATLPAYLNALGGQSVHVVTVNDYLAKRDAVWMGQIHNFLGLSVGCIINNASFVYDQNFVQGDEIDQKRDLVGSFKVIQEFLRPVSRHEAYQSDIVYGTNNEFGFDYLRDNMAYDVSGVNQRGHHFAIIDEVDSILIDEARTPLIISAPSELPAKLYSDFARLASRLIVEVDYVVDEKMRAVSLTGEGISKVEKILGISNLYDTSHPSSSAKGLLYLHHLEQSLKARILFHLDRDYIVKNDEIIIVDEFTGRILPGRRFSEGLHQAIEAKEGVTIQKESRTLASITFQNYFRLYQKLSGMTGTGLTSMEEFTSVYRLEVVAIPTNQTMSRVDLIDVVYKTEAIKWRAVVKEIKECHGKGQPILVGTLSIFKNEQLSLMLKKEGVPHEILNAKNHEREGEIIAQAGKYGSVTIATNMAGRGVDIILGGHPSILEEANKVKEVGGLKVIGTERHEARRIDNQLRGRSGRQGDPGATQFFVSLEDDLMRIFGGSKLKDLIDRFDLPEDLPLENKMISRAIEAAQSKIEGFNFDMRKHVLEFDQVLNKHRETVYRLRREFLISDQDELLKQKDRVLGFIKEEFSRLCDFHLVSKEQERESGVEQEQEQEKEDSLVSKNIKAMTGLDLEKEIFEIDDIELIKEKIITKITGIYEQKETIIGFDQLRVIEKQIYLQTIDTAWMNHLDNMDHLRDSVRLRAWGQRDPLVEYKNEGYLMFQEMLASINLEFISIMFKIEVGGSDEKTETIKLAPINVKLDKIGRNDNCYCGAKKLDGTSLKYKHCHGR
ncbi:preprotein translocase subunit SecA [Candidatus Azambacteria bacterium]|nr:preprotein translocase subunit SecA [Candidatus Azambacteria bacterium]